MNDLILQHIGKSYGDKTVLADFSHTFHAGKRTCIMGPSGCGKTTLLRIILGLETPDRGTITGRPDRVSAVFQENRLFEDFSALSNLAAVCHHGDRQVMADHLTELGLGDSLHKPVRTLSGGMKRRVAIARAVLAPGELMILDEPFTGLDKDTKEVVVNYLKHHTQDRTLIIVTHDPAERDALADAVLDMT
ncbi:MAG: ABC transporter ATP-binding protein [Ruminiclostridium sp.]|nr:ABC transporter ATP-binding protein [Ruminiclostridium sp.]